MNNSSGIGFGDKVRVIKSDITIQNKLDGLQGEIYGETVPSVSLVEVIGELKNDFALNVHFEQLDKSFWVSPDLLELVDHNEGLTIGLNGKEWIRNSKGEWVEKKKKGIFSFLNSKKRE